MHQVTIDVFPESWRADQIGIRSHDSHVYGQRFMLRLDKTTTQQLQELVAQFGRSRAAIIRQLVAQETPQDFTQSWRLAAATHRPPDARPADRGSP